MIKVPYLRTISASALLLGLASCASSSGPPSDIGNACSIVQERDGWYKAARRAAKKWKAPTPVILAIIWRESQFQGNARTPRKFALGVVPWGRQSSAYGFAQAIDGTWDWYRKDQNASGADRDDFGDAADFVGWYMDRTRKKLGISMQDARKQYLAYHEGHGGYRTGKWRQKAFLVRASKQVERMTRVYDSQLLSCDADYARDSALGVAQTPMPRHPPFALTEVTGIAPIQKPGTKTIVPGSCNGPHDPNPQTNHRPVGTLTAFHTVGWMSYVTNLCLCGASLEPSKSDNALMLWINLTCHWHNAHDQRGGSVRNPNISRPPFSQT